MRLRSCTSPISAVGAKPNSRKQLLLDLEDAVFAAPEQQQACGVQGTDLPAQFRPDRPAAARHENALTADVGRDRFHIDMHGIAAQQVLDVDVAHRPHANRATQHFRHRRHDAKPRLRLLAACQGCRAASRRGAPGRAIRMMSKPCSTVRS